MKSLQEGSELLMYNKVKRVPNLKQKNLERKRVICIKVTSWNNDH